MKKSTPVRRAPGTRDFLPEQMHARLHVIGRVREMFTRFGYDPLETPAFELLETLTGKYGDEGEKLLFRILKRGEGGAGGESDLGLRYDLTVPLARVVAMNPELRRPFKRYQIQPVWRAERQQRGRFREFFQCDIDTVGAPAPFADAECVAVVHAVLHDLGFRGFSIRVNHRKLLRALVETAGVPDRETTVLIAVDKLDKIGRDGVTRELAERGIASEAIDRLWGLLDVTGADALPHLERELGESGRVAIAEIRAVLALAVDMGVPEGVATFDATLARGLSYYTGPIFEAEVLEPKIGSVAGGGRYDGLVGMFSGEDVPAVGVSLGLERLFTVMEELKMIESTPSATRVLVTVFSEELRPASLRAATAFRAAGIATQTWIDVPGKLGRQFKYADQLGAPWSVTIGPDEASRGACRLKNLKSGDQRELSVAEAVQAVLAGS